MVGRSFVRGIMWALTVGVAGGCAASTRHTREPAACPPCVAASSPASAATPATSDGDAAPRDLESVKRALIDRINAGDADGVFALYGSAMRGAFPVETVREFVARVRSVGRIQHAETAPARSGAYELSAERGRVRVELSIDAEAKITRLLIVPAEPREPDPPIARNEIRLALPLRGQCFVHRRHQEDEQEHSAFPSQRRAVDLVVVDEAGKSFRSDGKRNEDFYAWGKPVLAAADGKVVTVVDGVPENEPKNKNGYIATGNLVIIEHTPRLFSAYAHLQRGSIRVRAGNNVRRGQLLGLVGNTGNSTEPHLHFQLQDGPRFEQSWGVEAVFSEMRVSRKAAETLERDYIFRTGDRIQAPR